MKTDLCILGAVVCGTLLGCGVEGSGSSGDGGHGSSATNSQETSASSSSGMPRCGADNCAGCCFSNVCQPGNTASGCGKDGAICEACSTGDVCKVDQTCGIDPASMWEVRPMSAVISATNNGASWDFGGGAPDPFVNLYCPASAAAVTASTTAASDTFTPMWNNLGCVMSAHDLMTFGVGIEVWDEDGAVNDVIAPKGAVTVPEQAFHSGGFQVSNQSTLVSLVSALIPK